MTNRAFANTIISEILMEAVEDDWGTNLAHRITNHSLLDDLNEDEREMIMERVDAIAWDVRDAIYKLAEFISSVG
jgi:hypothetical protein